MESIPHRKCSVCKQEFPLTSEYWHRDKTDKQGFVYACKECAKKRARKWVGDNPERNKENCLNWYYSNQECVKAYRQEHADHIAEWKREWRRANPEMVKKHKFDSQRRNRASHNRRNKRYRERHPMKIRQKARVEWARRRTAEGKYTQADIDRMYFEQEGRCAYCGITLHERFDVDHIVPLTRGGTNHPENIILACRQCNRSKSDKLVSEWQAVRGW